MRPRLLWLTLCVLLLVPLPAYTAEPSLSVPAFGAAEIAKSQPIALTGPASLAVGQEGVWRLTGTPAVDLTRPLLDQLSWALGADRMFIFALPPGKAKVPLDVRLELVVAVEGATLQPVIRYTPDIAGEHRVLVDWNHGQDQLAEALLTVGKGPDPGPNPPDPAPNPSAKWQVMFFHQSDQLDNLPVAQRDMLTSRSFREALEAKGHSFEGAFDVDAVAKSGRVCGSFGCVTVRPTVAKDMAPWWEAVEHDPMPRVAIAPMSGGDVRDFPLPADAASLYKLLEAQK